MFPVKSYTFSKKTTSTHHLEGITVGYSWAYLSLGEQEMAYFSWVDPVPAREVANHIKLVWSGLFTHSNLHRWERMGCRDEYSRALFSPPTTGEWRSFGKVMNSFYSSIPDEDLCMFYITYVKLIFLNSFINRVKKSCLGRCALL